jgi:hypothetical protein
MFAQPLHGAFTCIRYPKPQLAEVCRQIYPSLNSDLIRRGEVMKILQPPGIIIVGSTCARGKIIGRVVVVSTKITTSRDLGT